MDALLSWMIFVAISILSLKVIRLTLLTLTLANNVLELRFHTKTFGQIYQNIHKSFCFCFCNEDLVADCKEKGVVVNKG